MHVPDGGYSLARSDFSLSSMLRYCSTPLVSEAGHRRRRETAPTRREREVRMGESGREVRRKTMKTYKKWFIGALLKRSRGG